MVTPAREPAVNRMLVSVVGGELVCGMVEHPRVHMVLTRAVRILVRVGLKIGEAQFHCSPLPFLSLTRAFAHTSQW